MPKISEMRESKFLAKGDVGRGVLVTIAECLQKNVNAEGADPEKKWCLTFQELDKPLVLNMTNATVCAQICGSEDTDQWTGKRIVLFTDPNVMYAGKMVGGIRVRAPKPNAPPPPPPPTDIIDSDIPF